jgi:outer membrane protein TolC
MKLISLLRITNFVTLLVLFLGTVNVLSGQTTYLTLEECRAKAIAHNKILQAAQAQQQSAQSTRKASFTQFFPRVHTLGSYTYVDENIDYTMDLPSS